MAARTIPFPHPPGNAAAPKEASTPPPPPQTGAAQLILAPRRYRGLHLVADEQLRKLSGLDRFAQTRAIVAQVEREIAQRAQRSASRRGTDLMLLSPVHAGPSLPVRAARRVVLSLFSAGL